MLSDLHIENIAVIERADIAFGKGFNVLTGETGAGKSIIIDSLFAISGARASKDLVRSGENKATVSAVFYSDKVDNWLENNDLDKEDDIVIQRRINEEGRSSCRVCGNPISASQLRELSSQLLDMHGQNDGRQLMDEDRHRDYLDNFGDYKKELTDYESAYKEYKALQKDLNSLNADEENKAQLIEILKITIRDLENAGLREGEEEELNSRLSLLRNSEKLTESLESAYAALYANDDNAISLTDLAASDTARAARYCEKLESVSKNLEDAAFMLRDASEILRSTMDELDFSPEEYDRLETRLSQLKKLFKKYGGDEAQLLMKLEDSKTRLDNLEFSDSKIEKLNAAIEKQIKKVMDTGAKLSSQRKKTAKELEKRITNELKALSMPAVAFTVEIKPINDKLGFDAGGIDSIRFLMSANKGERPGPISKIASGGELSRIMLAMKNVFSEKDGIDTLVFDEIDTGVSGIAAQRVGEKLAQLSQNHQVLCVTHLPQIAAMADKHFLIEKSERDGRTFTNVKELDFEGRVKELARLHGGDNITETTLTSAKEQLQYAEDYKKGL